MVRTFIAAALLLMAPLGGAVTVLNPTDGDVDFIVTEGGLNDGQFLALTLPGTLPGAFWALDASTAYSADQVSVPDISALSATGEFSVAVFDGVDWHFLDTMQKVTGDATLLDWTYDQPQIDWKFPGISLAVVDASISAVPLPLAALLFGAGIVGLVGVARRGNA